MYRTLAILFGIDKDAANHLFWKTLFVHYHSANRVPKMWPTATEAEMDQEFARMKAEEDVYFTKLSQFIVDPLGANRYGVSINGILCKSNIDNLFS